jgi:hypothetical protein
MTILQRTKSSLPRSCWPKNRLLKCNAHHIPLIWPGMTSGCFQKESALKGRKSQETEDIKKWRWHWKLFHNKSSTNVSSSGNTVGISA